MGYEPNVEPSGTSSTPTIVSPPDIRSRFGMGNF
jgi:hypothetical protein